MNVAELIQRLKRCNPESEVRIAHQPSWPFELSIGEVLETEPEGAEERREAELAAEQGNDGAIRWLNENPKADSEPRVVYIAEAGQIGYLPGEVKYQLGW